MSDTISRSQAIVEMMDEDVDYVQGTSGREVIQILMDLPDKQPPQRRWRPRQYKKGEEDE